MKTKFIDITPIHDDSRGCFDDLYISYLTWKNKGFELIFSESWDFKYQPVPFNRPGAFGKSIASPFGDYLKIGKRYYNIITEIYKAPPDRLMKAVKEQINQNNPVLIFINGYWNPWHPIAYKKYDVHHYAMINGYDDEKKVFRCIDGAPLQHEVWLPYDHFYRGTDEVFILNETSDKTESFDLREIFDNVISRIKGNQYDKNMFESFEQFALDIEHEMDISLETSGLIDNPFIIPLFESLRSVFWGRTRFAAFLKYVRQFYNYEEITEMIDMFDQVATLWDSIRGILIKSYFMPDSKRLLKKAAEKIREVSSLEKQIFDKLENIEIRMTHKPIITQSIGEKLESLKGKSDLQNVTCYCLSLNPYYNNSGFGREDKKITAHFSSGGGFYLADSLADYEMLNIECIQYKLPDLNSHQDDNIACLNQEISIDSDMKYSNLHILASCEWGSHVEKLQVIYSDKQVETFNIEISDWTILPKFGETIAWTGEAAVFSDNQYNKFGINVYLFSQTIKLNRCDRINKLILPKNENMHIFAISLT